MSQKHNHESCCYEHNHKHNHNEASHKHEHKHNHDEASHKHNHEQPPHTPKHRPHGQQAVYILENLGCANCAAQMERRISELDGITSAAITFATKQLRITAKHPERYLAQIQEICSSIEDEVRVVEANSRNRGTQNLAHQEHKQGHDMRNYGTHDHTHSNHKQEEKKELTVILAGAALFLLGEIFGHITGIPCPVSAVICIAAYLLLGGEILLSAGKNIRKGQVFDENFLMSIATLGALAIGEFEEAVGVMLFFRIGEFFEHAAVEKSRSQIMEAVDLRPETVNLILNHQIHVTPAEEVMPGDILLVRPGDRIPLDGIVIEGESRMDTSPITGEPVPVKVTIDNQVISGCVNTSGQLKIRVEKPLAESMVTRILDSVENAAASKPKIDRFITRFARIYTPIVVLIALGTAVIPSLFTGNWNYWVYTALTFLVMSCPCALVLSVPLAFFSGIGSGSKKGILFKGGLSIEALSKVNTVVMDKTGTITQGNFVVQQVMSMGSRSPKDLLHLCASCEQHSTHPIANSIVTAAQEQHISLENPISLEEIPGHGIKATLSQGDILCGNVKLMEQFSVSLENYQSANSGSEVLIAINGIFEGFFIISDTLKPDAKGAIRRLKQMNVTTAMLTGDAYDSAQAVAAETGIDEVHAKLLPEDKLTRLSDIRRRNGAAMFVGDGINDAPVLAGADVGAAMGSGADAAIEAADVVFMTSAMEAIPQALSIARTTSKISTQNVVFALVIKIATMILGLCGFASMWMAVFADTGVAMLCILNSIRILYKK